MKAALPLRASTAVAQDFAARESHLYTLSCQFLGGSRYIKTRLSSRSEVHAAILEDAGRERCGQRARHQHPHAAPPERDSQESDAG
ncbi:MAG: hypothetical protein MUF16_29550 [Burkholderiaceae bacterium]|nr:hypothetical protein [Burkholderiaceae bacterium]